MKVRLYTFRCPECKNRFTYDEPAEPMCTGPGAVDQHDPTIMHRVAISDRDIDLFVSPKEGAARAAGPLLTPEVREIIRLGSGVEVTEVE